MLRLELSESLTLNCSSLKCIFLLSFVIALPQEIRDGRPFLQPLSSGNLVVACNLLHTEYSAINLANQCLQSERLLTVLF